MKHTINSIAPDFTALDQNGNKIHLHSLKGKKVVIFFYPTDMTPGCTIESKQFSALKEEFLKLNTLIFGISKNDIKSHIKFIEKCGLNVDLLDDSDHEIAKKYDVWGEKSFMGKKYMGISRTTFLINEEGKIEHIWENVKFHAHATNVLNYITDLEE